MTWEATANAIQRYLFDLKDCLVWVDDYSPKRSIGERARQDQKAKDVMQAWVT